MYVYADNAATTKTSEEVKAEMLRVMNDAWGNPSSLHTCGQTAMDELFGTRQRIANVLGVKPHEIVFTSGGSESDNQAIISSALSGAKHGKKHIVTTEFEHHAVLNTVKMLAEYGFSYTLVPINENGIVYPESIEKAVREDTALVSVMYANNEIGTIQPIADIAKICKERSVPFHTDAVQAFGHIKLSLENVDLMSLSAHKFHGPRGVGLLYVNENSYVLPLIHGGSQERGLRAGTENLPGIVGMAIAMEQAKKQLESNRLHILPIRNRIISELLKISDTVLNGDIENRLPGNINISFRGIDSEALILQLDLRGIEASSGSACTAGSLEPSHVLTAIGRDEELAICSLRLSLGEDISDAEADYIIKNVAEAVDFLRKRR